ncbi:MAG: 7-cyano-7-deazaguanine synthase [Acidiferrobacteraceae bacterium]
MRDFAVRKGTAVREHPPGADGAVLLSGGIESTTLLHEYRNVLAAALFVDYDQRAARYEAAAAREQCTRVGLPLSVVDARAIGRAVGALRPARFHVPLPQRNLFAIAAGLNWVSAAGGRRLYLGVNADDASHDPSAAPAQLDALAVLLQELSRVQVVAPYLALSKAEVVMRGIPLGVEYRRTYSCLRGRKRHCGRCPQCLARRAAMAAAGIVETDGCYEST